MSNKLLFITQVFYPDEVSTASLFTDLCSALVKDEIEIEVWCAQPSYTYTKRQSRRLLHNGIKIYYLASTNFKKTFIAGRIINYFTFMTSVFIKLLFSGDKRPVITHTTPPTLAIFLSVICFLKRRKFIQVLLDIFPEGLIRLGKLKRNNLVVRTWNRLFLYSLNRTDRLIVIGRDMKAWIEKLLLEPGKIDYIPLWQDDELISPLKFEENKLIAQYGLRNEFIIQYSGNMGLWNDMKTIGKAVMQNPPGVKFLFIGGGMRKKELLEYINSKISDNFLLLPFQTKENFSKSITACHASIVSLAEGLEGIAVPSKIFGIMAAGVPVIAIAPTDSEIARIINEEKCGILVNPGDDKALIEAILLLKSDEDIRKIMGENGRRAFLAKYTIRRIAQQYKSLFESVI